MKTRLELTLLNGELGDHTRSLVANGELILRFAIFCKCFGSLLSPVFSFGWKMESGKKVRRENISAQLWLGRKVSAICLESKKWAQNWPTFSSSFAIFLQLLCAFCEKCELPKKAAQTQLFLAKIEQKCRN